MKKTRSWLVLPLLAVVAYLGFKWLGGSSESARDEPPAALFDRIWFEQVPDKPTDYLHGAFVLEAQPIGLFQRSSAYDYHFELFEYDRDKANLKLTFPQSGKKAKLSYTIKGCDEMPPFDLCLTLTENPWGGPRKYYGFSAQEDEAKQAPGMRASFVEKLARAASH